MAAFIVVLPQKVPPPLAITVAGNAFTVRLAVVMQPVGNVYVIPATPAETPVAIPVAEPIVATDKLPLLQRPPVDVVPNAVVDPAHTLSVPVIELGNGFTATGIVAIQPAADVYVIVEVPAATPVTIPVEPIVALLTSLLLQVPPAVASVKDVVNPTQTALVPEIAAGNGLMVTDTLPSAPQHPDADNALK